MVGEEKMSKSLGNFTSLTDLLSKTDARAYRLLVLRSHYRSPIEVTPSTIADAERALSRLDALARRFDLAVLAGERLEVKGDFDWPPVTRPLYDAVTEALDEDLDTPQAVALLFEALSQANTLADSGNVVEGRHLALAVNALFGALGLALRGGADQVDEVSQALVERRDEARNAQNWAEADRLRDELVALGWTVEDSVAGTLIRRR
jgi:cysteinyl-tRNA synthetase